MFHQSLSLIAVKLSLSLIAVNGITLLGKPYAAPLSSIPLRFESVAIILSLNIPDHDQDEQVMDALFEESPG